MVKLADTSLSLSLTILSMIVCANCNMSDRILICPNINNIHLNKMLIHPNKLNSFGHFVLFYLTFSHAYKPLKPFLKINENRIVIFIMTKQLCINTSRWISIALCL